MRKSNLIIIFSLIILFLGTLSFILIYTSTKSQYIQILGLFLGIVFFISVLLSFYGIYLIKYDETFKKKLLRNYDKKGNWAIYLLIFFTITCFIISVFIFVSKKELDSNDLINIKVVQNNIPRIDTIRTWRFVKIKTIEYPNFDFLITSEAYQGLDKDFYLKRIKLGDTIILSILKEDYLKKICKIKQLTFLDKHFDFKTIVIHGLNFKGYSLISKTQNASNNDNEVGSIFFLLIGFLLLYGVWRELKKKKKPAANTTYKP